MIETIETALPTVQQLAVALVFFLGGALVPTYYAQERFRGFGRSLVDKLPYHPPPGMDEKEALEAAVESAAETADETDN